VSEQLELPFQEEPIDKFLVMSNIVMKINKELEIRRNSKEKIKRLKSELNELAKKSPT